MRTRTALCAVILAALLGRAYAAEYFVSDRGKDANDGLVRERAFLTVQKGVDALKPGDTLTIAPGEYFGTVRRQGLGGAEAVTTIRAEVPGTVILRGESNRGKSGANRANRGTHDLILGYRRMLSTPPSADKCLAPTARVQRNASGARGTDHSVRAHYCAGWITRATSPSTKLHLRVQRKPSGSGCATSGAGFTQVESGETRQA